MARASIEHRFTDGATVTCAVETTNDFADAAADCIARVVELYRLAVADSE